MKQELGGGGRISELVLNKQQKWWKSVKTTREENLLFWRHSEPAPVGEGKQLGINNRIKVLTLYPASIDSWIQ